jgi:hybrid cluster-associated redox disulfide protein
MKNPIFSSQSVIAEILRDSPSTIHLFLEKNMNCVGCVMASFCSLESACKAYNLALPAFIEELQSVEHEI